MATKMDRRMYSSTIVLILVTCSVQADINNGLVGWWKMNGDINDSARYSQNTSTFGNPTFQDGVLDESVSLDGNDCMVVDYFPINNTYNFTIACWAKASTSGLGSYRYLINSRRTLFTGFGYKYYGYCLGITDGNKWRYAYGEDGTTSDGKSISIDTNVPATDNWTHLAVSHNTVGGISYISIYINGEEVINTQSSAILRSTSIPLLIGAKTAPITDTPTSFFPGLMDDVRIYNRILSAAEISELKMMADPAGNPTPANGYWGDITDNTLSWDGTAGATVYDIYYDTVNPPVNMVASDHPDPSYDVTMDFGVTYYWKIVKKTDAGTIDGPVWSFTKASDIIYVSEVATGSNNGTSWEDAFHDLQDGLAVHRDDYQIWVAEGVYKPTNDDNRGKSFTLRSNMKIYGGFPRRYDAGWDDRDMYQNQTILSGNLCSCDDPGLWTTDLIRSEGTNDATVLDGFIVSESIIGMKILNSSMKVVNCHFSGFKAEMVINISGSGKPTFNECLFHNNMLYHPSLFYAYGDFELLDCRFTNNTAEYIIDIYFCGGNIERCLIADNTGGGIIAQGLGSTKKLDIINCVIYGNSTNAIYLEDILEGEMNIKNSILWDNGGDEINSRSLNDFVLKNAPIVAYNIIEDGFNGIGNIDADPLFVDPRNGFFQLRSEAGHYDPLNHQWYMDSETSPGVDSGDPLDTIGDEQQPHGGRINMGIYGGTEYASKSLIPEWIAADVNKDGEVDIEDFGIIAMYWLEGTDN